MMTTRRGRLTAKACGFQVAALLFVFAQTASARDDAGIRDFFLSQAGGGEVAAASREAAGVPSASIPEPGFGERRSWRSKPRRVARRPLPRAVRVADNSDRPLTIRKAGEPVSIYEDPTLRKGDAVMTAKGVRVFAGSQSWPYAESDFRKLSDVRSMDQNTLEALREIDRQHPG